MFELTNYEDRQVNKSIFYTFFMFGDFGILYIYIYVLLFSVFSVLILSVLSATKYLVIALNIFAIVYAVR